MAVLAQINKSTSLVVNTIVASLADNLDSNYTWDDITNVSPLPGIGWTYNSTGNYTAPVVVVTTPPLNQQYSPQAYGMMLIDNFSAQNQTMGLSGSQIFPVIQTLLPYAMLLQIGDLSTFLSQMGNIPVDGVVITNARVSALRAAVQNYLNGD